MSASGRIYIVNKPFPYFSLSPIFHSTFLTKLLP